MNAEKIYRKANKEIYKKIKERIKSASSYGDYEIITYSFITPDVKKKLEQEGFSVICGSDLIFNDKVIISWDKVKKAEKKKYRMKTEKDFFAKRIPEL